MQLEKEVDELKVESHLEVTRRIIFLSSLLNTEVRISPSFSFLDIPVSFSQAYPSIERLSQNKVAALVQFHLFLFLLDGLVHVQSNGFMNL